MLYIAVRTAAGAVGDIGLPLIVLIYQTINFHHYIVDSVIWRSKKRVAVPAQPAASPG